MENKLSLPYVNAMAFVNSLQKDYGLNFTKTWGTYSSILPPYLGDGWLKVFTYYDIHFIRAKYRYKNDVVFSSTDKVGGDGIVDFRIHIGGDLRSSFLTNQEMYKWKNKEVDAFSVFVPQKYFKDDKNNLTKKYFRMVFDEQLMDITKILLQHDSYDKIDTIGLEGAFLNFLCAFVNYLNKPLQLIDKSGDYKKKLVDEVKRMLDENFVAPPTISQFAKQVGINTTDLQMEFKKINGSTIKQYCIEKKMNKAIEWVLYSKLPITRICEKLGYSNRTHFNQLYQRKTGLSPRSHRNTVSSY